MNSETNLVRLLSRELGLKNFSGDFQKDIGFEGILKNQGEKDGFSEFSIPIPKIKKESERKCTWCGGSGNDNYDDRECFMCSGSGKDFEMDWQEAFEVSASLTAFTRLLECCDEDTSASLPQLLTLETFTSKDMHGGSLGASISRPLRKWLSVYSGHNTIPEATKAMMTAHDKMFGLKRFDIHSFKIMVWEDGGLLIDCPGDACGVHPNSHERRAGRGYELTCHNVDSPAQQLTLITGLAAIHDRARKEITS